MTAQFFVSNTFAFSDTSQGYQDYEPVYKKVLEVVKPDVVYEWGPGKNTQMALDWGARVHSVEQDPKYLVSPHAFLIQYLMPVEHNLYARPREKGVDLYFVDSRRRAECIEGAIWASRDAVLVLHDAQRRRYWGALARYDFILIPDGCTAIAVNAGEMCVRLCDTFDANTNVLKRL